MRISDTICSSVNLTISSEAKNIKTLPFFFVFCLLLAPQQLHINFTFRTNIHTHTTGGKLYVNVHIKKSKGRKLIYLFMSLVWRLQPNKNKIFVSTANLVLFSIFNHPLHTHSFEVLFFLYSSSFCPLLYFLAFCSFVAAVYFKS